MPVLVRSPKVHRVVDKNKITVNPAFAF